MRQLMQQGLAALCLLAALTTMADPIKLAIIPTTPALDAVAGLLTAEFTAQEQLVLVERAEVERILKEQSVSLQNQNLLQLGHILGADGLFFMELIPLGKQQVLSLRLVSANTGIALREQNYTWPLDDAAQWSGLVARQFEAVFPKVSMLPKDGVGLSILSLRESARSAEALSFERDLTRLLHDRLMLEPKVLVLERRKLQLVYEENSLFSKQEERLWQGSYLLDGSIDKDDGSPFRVIIHARLIPPDSRQPIAIQAAGSRTNLAALTDELTRNILAALSQNPSSITWKPADEANQYLAEAKSAFHLGVMRDAQSASEATWALGLQNLEVAGLRVNAWQETGADRAVPSILLERSYVGYGSWPDNTQFVELLQAANAFEDAWRRFVENQPKLDAAWLKRGNLLLEDLNQWLKHYYFTPEAREGQETLIAQARLQASRMCSNILAHPDYNNADPHRLIWLAKAHGAAFWVDTPEQGIEIYRQMIQNRMWPQVRNRFVGCYPFQQESSVHLVGGGVSEGCDLASPPLAGWTWTTRAQWRAVWDQFVDNLCASDKPAIGFEGRFLKCASAWTAAQYEQTARELLEFALKQREALSNAGLAPQHMRDLEQLAGPQSWRMKYLSPERADRMQREVWGIFSKQLSGKKIEPTTNTTNPALSISGTTSPQPLMSNQMAVSTAALPVQAIQPPAKTAPSKPARLAREIMAQWTNSTSNQINAAVEIGDPEALFAVGMQLRQQVKELAREASRWSFAAVSNGTNLSPQEKADSLAKWQDRSDSELLAAAKAGERGAQWQLGQRIQRKATIEITKVIGYWERAAENSCVAAELELGGLYYKGSPAGPDHAKLRYWFGRAADHGSEAAQHRLAKILLEDGENIPRAIELLQQASDQGCFLARFDLAEQYACGNGTPRHNAETPMALLQLAATNGLPEAKYAIAERFRVGLGVERDLIKAIQWYQDAYKSAQRYPRNDRSEHFMILQLANENDKVQAGVAHLIGVVDIDGNINKEAYVLDNDLVAVRQLQLKSTMRRDVPAQIRLAELFEEGVLTRRHYAKAFLWYSIAANQGSVAAAAKRDELKPRLSPEDFQDVEGWLKHYEQTSASASK